MIPDEHAKSFLSKSYVNAVATQAGFICDFPATDYGVDAKISQVQFLPSGKYVETGCQFNVQIKASHNFKKHNDLIAYNLKADAYNRLVYHNAGLIVLVLFCLPEEPVERCILTEDCLELRNCCYWYHIKGDLTDNTASKVVQLPRQQVFDPDACKKLMELARNGDWKNGHINS